MILKSLIFTILVLPLYSFGQTMVAIRQVEEKVDNVVCNKFKMGGRPIDDASLDYMNRLLEEQGIYHSRFVSIMKALNTLPDKLDTLRHQTYVFEMLCNIPRPGPGQD
jgi:hypothetical protein